MLKPWCSRELFTWLQAEWMNLWFSPQAKDTGSKWVKIIWRYGVRVHTTPGSWYTVSEGCYWLDDRLRWMVDDTTKALNSLNWPMLSHLDTSCWGLETIGDIISVAINGVESIETFLFSFSPLNRLLVSQYFSLITRWSWLNSTIASKTRNRQPKINGYEKSKLNWFGLEHPANKWAFLSNKTCLLSCPFPAWRPPSN